MSEKKMTLGELVRWLDDNDVPYEINDAGKLTVKGNLREDFKDWIGACKYTSLPDELICVEGDLWPEQTSIMSLGGLISVGGDFYLEGAPITSLDNLTSVGEGLDLWNTSITSLGNLASVGGNFDLRNTSITSLGNLTSVGWNLMLQDASILSLDDLPQVGGGLYLNQSQCRLLTREVLRKVAGSILYWGLAENEWIALSPDELEAIVAENERRERLHNTRGSDVDWDLYDR